MLAMKEMTDPIENLTEGQKDCLRLYYRRFDAKEIGRRLQIAPSTVHQRLTAARKLLGVARSMEAARALAEYEGAPLYEDVLYDEIDVADVTPSALVQPVSRLPLPFPTRWRRTNDLSKTERLAMIVMLACSFMIAMTAYIFAIRALSSVF
jgi:DNA-binding CsgD family transcriptional regulator